MTTTRAPVQHGERRCYLRGCRRTECLNAHYRYMSRYRLDRERGSARRVPPGPAAQHVLSLAAAGWTVGQIAAAAGCAERTILDIRAQANKTIKKDLADRILKARPTLATVPGTTKVPAVGTVRRVQALMAIGHSLADIADAMGMARTALSNTVCGRRPAVAVDTARSAQRVYKEMSERPGDAKRSINRAVTRGWAPPAAWDDDTIDDPTARPEWTGHCGTDRGWWTHRQQNIPVCTACDQAHAQWKAEHNHLPRSEFMTSLGASRASASRRGESIAHDGRELLAQGYTFEHAAERLGITLPYLHHELRRHPVAVDEQEAAA
ncbi:hypothetical protein [Streptomyces sp. C3-3]|uniref:hypothetical protein n=1 Tax=Streptomyces sp. C3-3 TaxID=2824901 RepID=UPI001B39B7D3|nr:hypothetical protein [Streptomyces sp. C3-3]MBQ1118468.1 hypothetical protein [Streptomyces sp. C3-3]